MLEGRGIRTWSKTVNSHAGPMTGSTIDNQVLTKPPEDKKKELRRRKCVSVFRYAGTV